MKTLYMVSALGSDVVFFWAESSGEAKEIFWAWAHEDGIEHEDRTPCEATRVWADNKEMAYRGYVVKE